jgi:ferredoxin
VDHGYIVDEGDDARNRATVPVWRTLAISGRRLQRQLGYRREHLRGIHMRIVFDLNRCLGYAQCVPLAPEVIRLSGEEAIQYNPNPDDAQRQRVLRAAASCPVHAITVDQLDEPQNSTKP